jgi:hypothetical protein
MNRTAIVGLIFAVIMVFAQGLSKKCTDELMAISWQKNFDIQSFLEELTIEVAKIKTKSKLSFREPVDNKITDIGITASCLKAFPENSGQIQTMLANRPLCNGKQYNPLKQKCENNVILAVCGTTAYDPTKHSCKNNAVIARCGTTFYNPATHGCEDNTVLSRCGEILYNLVTHECRFGAVFEK